MAKKPTKRGVQKNQVKGIRLLSSFQIKVIALISMTLDHIAAFGFGIPIVSQYGTYLRTIGRIAAPLFLFVLVQSIRHTRSRPKFVLRLYLAGMCTELFVTAMNLCLGEVFTYFTPGNIIFTFFYTALYAVLLEQLAASWKNKDFFAMAGAIGAFAASLVPTILSDRFYQAILPSGASTRTRFLLSGLQHSIFPSFYTIDYGIGLVILGVAMYFAREKIRQCLVFLLFCAICIAGALAAPEGINQIQSFGFFQTFFDLFQCHMLLALPVMFLYNGKPGRNCKRFFYWYYPLHREAIYIISHLVAR